MGRLLLPFVLVIALPAVIVDRVAVTIGNQVITESELIREIQLAAFLNGEKPDLRPDAKRKAAERLIEQKLVRKEMELGRDPEPASPAAEEMLTQFEKQRARNPGEFDVELKQAGLTREELKNHLHWQAALLNFIDFRFRPAVQVTEQDIQKYYLENFQNAPGKKAAIEDVREQIMQIVTARRADDQMDAWLKDTRKHTRIEFHPEAFL